MRARALEVRTGVGGHGVVGVLRGGEPGPVIAFRADMDATATTAPDPVAFRSQVPGLRHICGHDIHTTVGLALADGLSAVTAWLQGTVVLRFLRSTSFCLQRFVICEHAHQVDDDRGGIVDELSRPASARC